MSAAVELFGGDAPRLIDLFGGWQSFAPRTPRGGTAAQRALRSVEPTRSGRDEDVVQARMRLHPGPRLQAGVTRQGVGEQGQVPLGMVRFDGGQERAILVGG